MTHMEQLKQIRADAIARLRASEDYKLAIKLGELIIEMGDTVDESVGLMGGAARPVAATAPAVAAVSVVAPASASTDEADDDEGLDTDQMIDSLVSEMESDGLMSAKDAFTSARESKGVNGAN